MDGRPVALAVFDFTVLGGSNGVTGMQKVARCAERALLDRIPLILLSDGGAGTACRRVWIHATPHPGHLYFNSSSICRDWFLSSRR